MPLSPQQKKLLEEKLEQAKKLVQNKPLEQNLVVAKRTFNAVKDANTKLSTFKTFDELAHDHKQKIKDFLRKKGKEFEALLAQYRKDIQEYQNKTGSIINNTIDKIQDFDVLLASHKQTLQERQQEADQIIRNTLERVGSITQPKDGKTPEKKELLALIQPLVDEKAEAMRKILSLDTLENRIEQIENRNKEFRFGGGGGGVHYFYELRDTPNRAGKLVPPYKGSEGKFIKVSADGKTLEFATGSGGSGDVATDAIWDAKGDLAAGTGANTAVRLPVGPDGTVLTADSSQATGMKWAAVVGTGDVVGPASATDNAIVRFDTTTGKLIQNSTVLIDDSGNVTGIGTLNTHTIPAGTGTLALTSDLAGYAHNSLSNLASVAINTSLISDTDSTDDLGSASIAWANLYVDTVRSATGNPLNITPTAGQNLNINLSTTGDFVVNTNQLYVDTSLGNVGIGTTAPASKLSVSGGATVGSSYTGTVAPSNGMIIQGNVGIGTTAPGTKLDVVGTIRANQAGGRLQAGTDDTGYSGTFGSTQHTDGGGLAYRTYWAYDAYWDETANQWNANRTTLGKKWMADMGIHQDSFRIRHFDGTVSSPWQDSDWSDLFIVKGTGNVGIGTTNPSQKLDVAGNINIAEDSYYRYGGQNALRLAKNGEGVFYSTLLGQSAGNPSSALSTRQTAVGYNAGYQNTGARQAAVGSWAGYQNTGASQTALGYYAGYQNTGNQVTGLGYEATRGNSGNDVVAIGYQAGKNNTIANQFIVKQANINTVPLIQGNFSTGNVGIGTTAPSAKLEVTGTTLEDPYIRVAHHPFSAGHAGILLGSTGSGGREYSITSGDTGYAKGAGLHFEQSDGLLVTMKNTGNVGIGTTSPQYKLDINAEFGFRERSSDPADPAEGSAVMWMSDGTGTGDDGDILMKITAGSVTKIVTLIDFSAL